MSGTPLQMSGCEKDLGVMVSSNLKWNKQHNVLLSKGSQKLGLLRRSCSFSKNILHRKKLYLAIVRSQFEHCSQIWRPVKDTQLNKFEALQKRGVKWVYGEDFICYSKSEYFYKLKLLDILPISLKFDLNDLKLFNKVVYGVSCITFSDYLVNNTDGQPNRHFQRQTRHTNLSDRLKFKCSIIPRVDAFADTFFHRTYLKWNDLPLQIREIEINYHFKTRLKQHFWMIAEEAYNG